MRNKTSFSEFVEECTNMHHHYKGDVACAIESKLRIGTVP